MNQLKALLKKNVKLTIRQTGTTLFQLITPILCLGFICFVKKCAEYLLTCTTLATISDFPFFFNLPFLYNKLDNVSLPIRTTSCEEWYLYTFNATANTTSSKDYLGMNDGKQSSSGMLTSQNNVLQSECAAINKMSPYFTELSKFNTSSINDYLYKRIDELKNTSNDKVSELPDGAITINELDDSSFEYNIQINDHRIMYYHRSNAVTRFDKHVENVDGFKPYSNVVNGALWIADLFNKAYISKLFKDKILISGVQMMPDNNRTFFHAYVQRIINLAGGICYPLGVSLLMPLFMHAIVLEKENKLIEIMKINGLKLRYYWLSNFLLNYLLYILTMILFICFGGYVLKLSLFTDTHIVILTAILLAWGICQIGLAFFYVAFINKARTATIAGYMLSIWTPVICVCLNLLVFESIDTENPCPFYLFMYPTFALSRLFYVIAMKCAYEHCIASLNDLNGEMIVCFGIMLVMGIVFGVVGVYLNEVLPQEYGVRRGVLFCCRCRCKRKHNNGKYLLNKGNKIDINDGIIITNLGLTTEPNVALIDNAINAVDDDDDNDNDNIDDIQAERNKVYKLKTMDKLDYPLVVEDLSKVYSSSLSKDKKSLDDLTLCLNKNEIFGLLGPNGAGKTTFFSLLTGIYEPTSGEAWVSGNSILTDINKVQELIGYCPQFDILWDDLSVEEHLSFYFQLKQQNQYNMQQAIEDTITAIKLNKQQHLLVKELSGGMKRRLSLGIAFLGKPSIIFLDEPTTGLDPHNKRQIWDILSNNKKDNKCIILTTHLMDEAEILSDRIGIIVNGKLRCLGKQLKLKKEHGKGFKLNLHLTPYDNVSGGTGKDEDEFIEMRKEYNTKCIKNVFHNAVLVESYKNVMVFEISNEEFNAEVCFNTIEENKKEMYISNWSVSQVSLEDIFIKLTENDLESQK